MGTSASDTIRLKYRIKFRLQEFVAQDQNAANRRQHKKLEADTAPYRQDTVGLRTARCSVLEILRHLGVMLFPRKERGRLWSIM